MMSSPIWCMRVHWSSGWRNWQPVKEWIASRPPGLCIVVIDTAAPNLPLDELRAAARAHPEQETHFVVIGRGNRREPRVEDADLVLLDGNVLDLAGHC